MNSRYIATRTIPNAFTPGSRNKKSGAEEQSDQMVDGMDPGNSQQLCSSFSQTSYYFIFTGF
jgi:hypothetical protein